MKLTTLPEIKNRPALVKALEAAKIKPIEINGAGKSLSVRLHDKDWKKFIRKVAQWEGTGNGTFVTLRKNTPYELRDDGFPAMSLYSRHQY